MTPGAAGFMNRSSRYSWYVLGLLALANVFNYMDRTLIAVVLPQIKAELLLSDTQLGVLTGIAFAVFYAVFGLPIARWADRGTRRTIVSFAIAAWSGMTVLCGAAQSYLQLLLARVGVGIGEAGCIPPSHSLIADYFPPSQRATAFGIHTGGALVGTIVGLTIGGLIAQAWGWRWAFYALGAPGILLAILLRATVREPRRGALDAPGAAIPEPVPLGSALATLWRRSSYVHMVVTIAFITFASFGVSTWLPSFYVRSFGLSAGEVGFYLGIVVGLGGVAGTALGGVLADRLGKGDLRRPLLVQGGIAFGLGLPLMLCTLVAPTAGLALAANTLWAAANALITAPAMATMQAAVSNRLRATATAVCMFAAALVGIGLGPLLIGMLSDALTPRYGAAALRYSLLWLSVISVYPALHVWLAARALQRDQAATNPSTATN